MKVFLDSSAWAKRYIEEPGSAQVEDICLKAEDVNLSILCLPEIISAFCRLRREKRISESQFRLLKRTFFAEIQDIRFINITPKIITQSLMLLEKYPLRTLDALQIACAKAAHIDLFVTADRQQGRAAEKSGLKTQYLF